MNRRELREHIIKLLFITQFWEKEELAEQYTLYLEHFPEAAKKDLAYIRGKTERILERLPEIDAALEEASKGWRVSRMGKADLSILRLAVYEMKFDEEVPVGVAINEAVELAKQYGQDESASFVNGILGKLSRADGGKKE